MHACGHDGHGADWVDGACAPVLVSSGYDFNDDITTTGVAFCVELVRSVLAGSE